MPANYETKYSEKEFEIRKLKRDMKYGPEPTADLLLDDPRMEMNQLIESDVEAYQPDSDESSLGGLVQSPGGGINDDLDSEQQFDIRERQFQKAFALDQEEDVESL